MMQFPNLKFVEKYYFPLVFLLSISLWIYAFRGYLSGQLALTQDALPYFDHTKFFYDNITHGIYPLWDPKWHWGMPITFFLRRIGETNPLYLMIFVFHKLGFPYFMSYLLFLGSYYLFGCVGFYLLARHLLKETQAAFLAYLLLLFSSLGMKLFDSYLLLVFVPLVWFFYFLVSFCQQPRQVFLLGLTLCGMILLTTYVPFYALTVILSFLILFVLLYLRQIGRFLHPPFVFLRHNKGLICFCLIAVGLSMLPGLLMYQEAGRGEIVLPVRHWESPMDNVLGLTMDQVQMGGFTTSLLTERLVSSLKEVTSAELASLERGLSEPGSLGRGLSEPGSLGREVPAVPRPLPRPSRFQGTQLEIFSITILAYILLGLGLFTELHKKTVLLFGLGFWFFLIILTDLTPITAFLYQHIFYFKFFRNLHHFLWLAILPALILFIAEQFRLFIPEKLTSRTQKAAWLLGILLVHAGILWFFLDQGIKLVSIYIVLGLSVFFLSFLIWGRRRRSLLVLLWLLLVTVLQPLEVFEQANRYAPRLSYRMITSS